MEKINIGVVGLNFGKSIIKEIVHGSGREFFQLAAVCDKDTNKANVVGDEYDVKSYSEISCLLESQEIQVIGLFTGPAGRSDLIRKIIRSGKNVVTTKPFELNSNETVKVLKEAENLGKIICLNSPSPVLSEDLLTIVNWCREYNLGKPVGCRSEWWASSRTRTSQEGKINRGKWYDDPQLCPVAPIFRIGIYMINDIVRLFGRASEVQILQSRLFTGKKTSDNAQMGILFQNGAIANIYASFVGSYNSPAYRKMIINYENGNIIVDRSIYKKECKLTLKTKDNNGNIIKIPRIVKDVSGEYQWKEFYRMFSQETDYDISSYYNNIIESIKIIEAMTKAQDTNKTENINQFRK